MKKLILEVGKKFGSWTVFSDETVKKNNLTHWYCECGCGVKELVPLNNLMNGSSTKCKYCAAQERGEKKRGGAGNISGDMWSQFLARCKKKSIKVEFRVERAFQLFQEQEGRCGISGIKIELSGYPYDREKTTAILIRKNCDENFTLENSLWVHKDIAKMKGKLPMDKFVGYVWKIASEQSRQANEKWKEKIGTILL